MINRGLIIGISCIAFIGLSVIITLICVLSRTIRNIKKIHNPQTLIDRRQKITDVCIKTTNNISVSREGIQDIRGILPHKKEIILNAAVRELNDLLLGVVDSFEKFLEVEFDPRRITKLMERSDQLKSEFSDLISESSEDSIDVCDGKLFQTSSDGRHFDNLEKFFEDHLKDMMDFDTKRSDVEEKASLLKSDIFSILRLKRIEKVKSEEINVLTNGIANSKKIMNGVILSEQAIQENFSTLRQNKTIVSARLDLVNTKIKELVSNISTIAEMVEELRKRLSYCSLEKNKITERKMMLDTKVKKLSCVEGESTDKHSILEEGAILIDSDELLRIKTEGIKDDITSLRKQKKAMRHLLEDTLTVKLVLSDFLVNIDNVIDLFSIGVLQTPPLRENSVTTALAELVKDYQNDLKRIAELRTAEKKEKSKLDYLHENITEIDRNLREFYSMSDISVVNAVKVRYL